MARGVNKVILLGNLGNDPDVKYTQGGMAIATLSLATTYSRKDKEGNFQEKTEWHRVKLFGKTAEVAGEYLKKGSLVYLEGRLKTEKYDDKGGETKYFTKVVTQFLQFLSDNRAGDTLDAHVDLNGLDNEKDWRAKCDFEKAIEQIIGPIWISYYLCSRLK